MASVAPARHARVAVQSRECSTGLLERLSGSTFFPERPMGAAIVADVCRAGGSLLYVAAPEIADLREQVDYYLGLLPVANGESVTARRDRLSIVSLADSSSRWLSTKLTDPDNPASAEARQRIRDFVDRERQAGADVGLSYFEPSENLERLAAELGISGDQALSRYIGLGTKAAGRQLFASAGIDMAAGTPECRSLAELAASVAGLIGQGHPKLVLKLSSTEYGGGLGNALLDLSDLGEPGEPGEPGLACASEDLIDEVSARLPDAALVDGKLGWPAFADAIRRGGAIAEELIEGDEVRSPSFQGWISASGEVSAVSTHEQLLGETGQSYSGCLFPASDEYRSMAIKNGLIIGQKLAELGIRGGDYGVDFVAVRRGGLWILLGCELNLRATGTKHGLTMVTSLLGTTPDDSGRLFADDGSERVYLASDGVADARYVGLRPRDLIAAVQSSPLAYDHDQKTGVVLHMMSAAVQYGKFGAVCIGKDQAEVTGLLTDLRTLMAAHTARIGSGR